MKFIILRTYPDYECGHEIEEHDNIDVAKKQFNKRKEYKAKDEDIQLLVVLEEA